MPKTVRDSKFQEWKGLDRISLIVHEMKCIFREITKDDFGIDGEIEVVTPKSDGSGYQTTGSIIKVQAKSGISYVTQDTDTSFASPVSKNDLETWYHANCPTIYIVYHPEDDRLYWKEIQSYVKTTSKIWQPPLKIVFNKTTDEFSPSCFQSVRSLAPTAVSPRISFTDQERLFSNLLQIKQMPQVWSAPTTAKNYNQVRSAISGFVPPFTISAGRLFTLSNLNDSHCTLRRYCDISKVRAEAVERWWEDEDQRREYVFLLNQLLGIHCSKCGIRYNKEFRRNYFPRANQTNHEFGTQWYNVRTGRQIPNRQTAKFYTYGSDRFWRHAAAELEFRLIGRTWFLQITPKYFFTEDGIAPWDSNLVGSYTTRIKAQETNQNVLNHVLFWADVLSHANPNQGDKDEIVVELDRKPVMTITKLPLFGIAQFAIPYDPVTFEEPEPSRQLSLLDWLDQAEEDFDDD